MKKFKHNSKSITIILLTAIIMLFGINLFAEDGLIGYWNFNQGSSGSPWNVPINADAGVGSAVITGGTWTWGDIDYTEAFSGSTMNALNDDPAGASLSLRNNAMNGNYIQLECSMVGLSTLEISYWTRKTSTGFKSNQWSWSTDGTNFTDFGPIINPTESSDGEVIVVWAPPEVDDASTVYLRYTLDGATSNVGNNRIDNLQLVSATQVATPVISPPSGTYYDDIEVEISTATADATLYYSMESDEGPWVVFSEPFTITPTLTVADVYSYGKKTGLDDSEVAHNQYTFSEFSLICNGNFEDWTDGLPDCWYGSKSNIGEGNVNQYSADPHTGSYAVQLVNSSSSHQRFSSQPTTVEEGTAYNITFWVKGKGEIRTGLFDNRSTGYGYAPYNSYIDVDSDTWSQHTQVVTAANTADNAEFIFSLLNTSEAEGHLQLDNVSVEVFSDEPTEVDNIAELREGMIGARYILNGEAVVTFAQDYRNQKFIQDETAAIMIDDADGIITEDYQIGDGIIGLKGVLGQYGGMLQIVPEEDPGEPNSTGNTVEPEKITLATITSDDQAKLLLIESVDFISSGTFAVGTVYDITDPSGTGVFRTNFYDVDYIGVNMPTETINLVALMTEHYDAYQLTARSSEDFKDDDDDTSVEYDDLLSVVIYPNPFSNNVYLKNLDNARQIVLMNLVGQITDNIKVEGSEAVINTSEYQPGIYLIRITMNDGSQISKKIVKH